MEKISADLQAAVELLRNAELDTNHGMPQELFWLVSSLVPLANVDLLVTNDAGQLLLSRRNDGFYESSWHILGGCLHYEEEFLTCVQNTAIKEIGCNVTVDSNPVAVRNVVRGPNKALQHPRERGHNVAILYHCTLPKDFVIDNQGRGEQDDGYLKWFDTLPPDFMKIQRVYEDVLTQWKK